MTIGFIFIGLLIAMATLYLRQFVSKKAENLAQKQDLADLTTIVERVKSQFERANAVEQLKLEKEFRYLREHVVRSVRRAQRILSVISAGNPRSSDGKSSRGFWQSPAKILFDAGGEPAIYARRSVVSVREFRCGDVCVEKSRTSHATKERNTGSGPTCFRQVSSGNKEPLRRISCPARTEHPSIDANRRPPRSLDELSTYRNGKWGRV